LFHKRYDSERTISVAKFYAKQIQRRLPDDVDVVFAPSSIPLTYLKSDKIKVFYTDATFNIMINYYPGFCDFSAWTIKIGNKMEEDAINNCDLVLYSSDWAANGAKNYKIANPDKIKVVPFGANIECSRTKDDIIKIIENKKQCECNLFFMGVDWERKGGNIALETAEILYQKGINVHLDIVGIKICPYNLPDYIESHGFVSKSTKNGREKIDLLFEKSHFFILPTRAECFGVVFAEASSFGLPILAAKTGGVASAVYDGKNGKLFDLSDGGEKYAEYVMLTLRDFENYKNLCFSSFEQYESCLNWKAAGEKILEHIEECSAMLLPTANVPAVARNGRNGF
jgi:glycosyltransferase involved in cell wall biosynthesis